MEKNKKLIEASFYKKLKEKTAGCGLCNRFCVIEEGGVGFCRARKNVDGRLYSLVYGRPASVNIDPIEKKPLYHFLPGSSTFSLGTLGCNFRCQNCHNYQISQIKVIDLSPFFVLPEDIVEGALQAGCQSISFTYNEPTIFSEYALDIMKLAKQRGLKNIWVSNGFMSQECLKEIIPYLDAVNIDLKSMDDGFYRQICSAWLDPVLENLKFLKESGVHLEIATLSIPTFSDSEEMFKKTAKFIADELGCDVPWHILSFSGEISWKLVEISSSSKDVLARACEIGREAGLNYVYAGEVEENTYCPSCRELAVRRQGFSQTERKDNKGFCAKCGEFLNIKD